MNTFDNIDPNKIVNLFKTKNFEKKEYLLDLLKTAKTKNNVSEEVKKFQRIIV